MQRLKAKEDWEAAEDALEAIFELAPDCIHVVNLSAGTVHTRQTSKVQSWIRVTW